MSSSREILIVDDEAMVARGLQRALERWYVVKTSGSALDALARLGRGERFGVILCDVTMREMSGVDLHADLSSWAPDQAAAMIFMTGGTTERSPLDTMPNLRLIKPVRIGELRTIIDHRLSTRLVREP
ncbi:MAG: response regulator [Kofleriaceae bacterium]